jgi:subtilase family serine protease
MAALLPRAFHPRGVMKSSRIALAAAAAVTLVTSLVSVGTAADAASNAYSKRVCAHAATGYVACDARVRTDANLKPMATQGPTGYSPTQLRGAYGITATGALATTVAVVDAYANPNAAADLAEYRRVLGLPALSAGQFKQMNQSGGAITTVTPDVGWGQEEMLDLEMVSAMCPGCTILYVGANSASFNDLATAVNRAVTAGATVVSNSYGGPEFSSETTLQSAYNHANVTITASTGDSGYGAQAPAAFGNVVAVGGTHLVLSGNTRASETVWSGAGSGCSAYITKPTWQQDTACARRTIGDVAAVADPATGVSVYDSYGSTNGNNWYVFGGTSVSAPLIGGIYGLVSDGSPTVATKLYAHPAGSLYDVTSGSNGRCTRGKNTAGQYLCTGVAGYDGPTGNGTPNGTDAF